MYIIIGTTSDSNFDPRFELRALVCLQNPRGYPYEIWQLCNERQKFLMSDHVGHTNGGREVRRDTEKEINFRWWKWSSGEYKTPSAHPAP